ncbi:MAG: hypothetical protein IKO72_09075 [Kiritimatiellae bacterium]|nr:hypothetical protein [Kiritimatiellia bacterium]
MGIVSASTLANVSAIQALPVLSFQGEASECLFLDISKTGGECECDGVKRSYLLRFGNDDGHGIVGNRRPDVLKTSTLQHTLYHVAAMRTIINCFRINIPKQSS